MHGLGCSVPVKGMSAEYMRLSALFIRQRRTERGSRDSIGYIARLRQRSCGVGSHCEAMLSHIVAAETKKPRNEAMRLRDVLR